MSDLAPIVEIKELTKQFKKQIVLDQLDLNIYPGRIIGLLGPNGCGKSSLLRHIIGLYLPSSGSCSTFGCEAAKLGPKELSRIGYVHQEARPPNWMTVGQLIRYVSAHYSNWNHDLEAHCLTNFKLAEKTRVGSLSPGQRQKLEILLATGHDPDLLILDEPASALDPIARAQFLELLINIIQQETKTILIASHVLADVEKVIDHVILMKDGRIIENQSLDNLRENYLRICMTSIGSELPEILPFETSLHCRRDNHRANMVLEKQHFESLKNEAEKMNFKVEIRPLPLEELYKIILKRQ